MVGIFVPSVMITTIDKSIDSPAILRLEFSFINCAVMSSLPVIQVILIFLITNLKNASGKLASTLMP